MHDTIKSLNSVAISINRRLMGRLLSEKADFPLSSRFAMHNLTAIVLDAVPDLKFHVIAELQVLIFQRKEIERMVIIGVKTRLHQLCDCSSIVQCKTLKRGTL